MSTWPSVVVQHPVWLALVVPLAASLWVWRLSSRLLVVLRAVCLGLVLLGLAGVAVTLPTRSGTVVIVADRSQSMPADSEGNQKEAIDLVQRAMDPADRLAVVSFAQSVAVEQVPSAGSFAGFVNDYPRDASNLADALETALALIPAESSGRMLVHSDGRWTGRDPASVLARAAARGVAIDYRAHQRPTASDVAIVRLDAPAVVGLGESFLLTAWVQVPVAQTISVELRRDGQRLSAGSKALSAGLNRLSFRDRAVASGTQEYALTVEGPDVDPVPENNRARLLVGVSGPKPLLCVSQSAASGLPKLLRGGGLTVVAKTPDQCQWTLAELSRYAGVLLENVPATKLGSTGMETLGAWVKETGGGLMLTGGRQSYGPGGYYRSPLEPLLPVSLELRNEHRKLSLAIVVVLDRSGSMALPAGGGRVKMDLANLGTAEVLTMLGPADEFGVIAVDTVAHTISDLAQVQEKDKAAIRGKILGIQSMGGGIYIHEALVAAAAMVRTAQAANKHIILFADAADSEEPGRYRELLKTCKEAGITVSVIGLGTDKDSDAELLRDIAKLGQGTIAFSNDPAELPRLFAQDTFVAARSTFLDVPTPIATTAGLTSLTSRHFTPPRPLGGYNLCYLRPTATLATVTQDEYHAPVTAAWQAGLGRVLCYTGEVDGKFTGDIATWGELGDYLSSLARWTTGRPGQLGDKLLLTQEVRAGMNKVRLHLDPNRTTEPFAGVPTATTLHGSGGRTPQAQSEPLHWAGADELALDVTLGGAETSLTTVAAPGYDPVALPPVCLLYSPEFRPVEGDYGLATLERLARASGGTERVELAGIWKTLPRHARLVALTPWLLLTAILVLLLEVLERRTGLLARQRVPRRPAAIVSEKPSRRVATDKPSAPAESVSSTPQPLTEPAPKPGLLDALKQARQKRQQRRD